MRSAGAQTSAIAALVKLKTTLRRLNVVLMILTIRAKRYPPHRVSAPVHTRMHPTPQYPGGLTSWTQVEGISFGRERSSFAGLHGPVRAAKLAFWSAIAQSAGLFFTSSLTSRLSAPMPGRRAAPLSLPWWCMLSSYLLSLELAGRGFIGICLYTLAAILIHELGHAAAALLVGFEIIAVRVGPVDFKRRMATQWALNQERWDTGFVKAQFRKVPGRWAAPRYCTFLLGGSVANLGVAYLLAMFAVGESPLGRVAGYLMIACILIGLCNLVPAKTKMGQTDGAKILLLIFNRRWRRESVLRLGLSARIIEIKALVHDHDVPKAVDSIDALILCLTTLPDVKPEVCQHLQKLRENIQARLAAPNEQNPAIVNALG